MAVSDQYREAIYREYMEFFERAERNRRWNPFDDVPWDRLDPAHNDEAAAILAETFTGVEMYLPDYVSRGINLVRETFGQAWFSANWGYEESKHAFTLREYLVRSGQRTPAQMLEYEKQILAQRWDLPFTTPRQMTIYGALQELATFMMYKHQLERARDRGDVVLEAIYGFISKDEACHADFYRKVVQLEIEEDRPGTVRDVALVFRKFEMPGVQLVPDYAQRTELMRRDGGVDRTVFLREVWFPTLRKLKIERSELTRASAEERAQLRAG